MGKEQARDRFRIPESSRNQIRGFTSRSSQISYQARLRELRMALGYGDKAIKLQDPQVIAKIDAEASRVANSIVNTYNGMLDSQLMKMPEGLTDAQIAERLQPFFASVADYNENQLIPYTIRWSDANATRDFYEKNNLTAGEWTWERLSGSDIEDECGDAADASPMSWDDLQSYEQPPVHPWCECIVTPPEIDPNALPAEQDLWDG